MFPLKQNTAETLLFFVHDANGDAVIGLSSGSFTKRISKGSASFSAMTVTITEEENGWYSIPLTTTQTNTLGILTIVFTNASAKQVNLQYKVDERLADDLAFPTVSGRSIDVEASGAITLVVTCTTNTDMRGTEAALLAADINLTAGKVDEVTLVVTTTTNSDMVGTNNAALKVDVDNQFGALNDISASDILATVLTESYNLDGAAPTLSQALFLIISYLMERSVVGTVVTAKKLDGNTTAATFNLDSATEPTSVTRVPS